MRKLTYLRRFNENMSSNGEEFKITDNDEIEGHYCKDFEVKDLKEGDIIFRRLIDADDNMFNWAKNKDVLKAFGLATYSQADKYKVLGIDLNNNKITLEQQEN